MSSSDETTHHETHATERTYMIIVTVAFVVAGAIAAPLLFPDVSTIRAAFGGAVFGVFCTFCALMQRMFE